MLTQAAARKLAPNRFIAAPQPAAAAAAPILMAVHGGVSGAVCAVLAAGELRLVFPGPGVDGVVFLGHVWRAELDLAGMPLEYGLESLDYGNQGGKKKCRLRGQRRGGRGANESGIIRLRELRMLD